MKRYYRPNHLLNMEGFPMHRRILYLALWERADLIGFSKVKMTILSEMCGEYTFMHEDIDALDPLVKRKGKDMVFLPHFLITQRKSLSLRSPGANRIWEALAEKFPGTTKQDASPYTSYMNSIGAGDLIPDMPEHVVEGKPPPKWMVEHLKLMGKAKTVVEPHEWPEKLLVAYRSLLDNFFSIAERITSKAELLHFRVGPNQILNTQQQIQNIINSYSVEIAEQQIRASINKNRLTVYPPGTRP